MMNESRTVRSVPFLTHTVALALALLITGVSTATRADEKPLRILDRLELFADDHVIDTIRGDAGRHVHQPEPREVVLVTDKPWEDNTSAYYTLFQDGEDAEGKPIDGFTLADCAPMRGDSIRQPVRWTSDSNLSRLAGKPVRVRFHLTRGDLYSFQFGSR